MHINVFRYILEYQRFEVVDAFFEETSLEAQNTLGHLVDRLLPLLDALHQPLTRLDFLLDVLLRQVAVFLHVVYKLPVVVADAQPRHAVSVESHLVFVVDLVDEDVGDDVVVGRRRGERASGLGFKCHDLAVGLQHSLQVLLLTTCDPFQILALQQLHVLLNDSIAQLITPAQ